MLDARAIFYLTALSLFLSFFPMTSLADSFSHLREQMVADIEQQVIETKNYTGKNTLNKKVIEVLLSTPRHEFVPFAYEGAAYYDRPLPIGHDQTISQPYIVALMTDLINPQPDHVVLEVGTGSGYQAAILSPLVSKVFSIEIVPELAEKAGSVLARLGYNNVTVKQGNGYNGWPQHAPFDGIIVTAGGSIPPLLVEQLKKGGRMVIPVGGEMDVQYLTLLEKDKNGQISKERILPVRFVPLIEKEKKSNTTND